MQGRKEILGRIKCMQFSLLDLTQSLWRAQVIPVVNSAVDFVESAASKAESADIVPTTRDQKNTVNRSMLLFTSHHVLADGVSLAAALADLADEAEEMRESIRADISRRRANYMSKSFWQKLYQSFFLLWWFVLGTIWVCFHQLKLFLLLWLWDTNPWKTLHKLASPRDPSRTVSPTQIGSLKQARWVAEVMSRKVKSKITINDVFVAAITGALARQLQHHRSRLAAKRPMQEEEDDSDNKAPKLEQQRHMTVIVPVHLKGGIVMPGESIGNNIGAFCARVSGESDDMKPAQRLEQVHRSLQAVKNTPAPILSHWMAKLSTHILPASWCSYFYQRVSAGATVVVSNVRGFPRAVHYQGREVESIYGFIPIPPGIPIGLVVQSYNEKMSVCLNAESWAIPDGDQFMVWVLEEYMALIDAARSVAGKQSN